MRTWTGAADIERVFSFSKDRNAPKRIVIVGVGNPCDVGWFADDGTAGAASPVESSSPWREAGGLYGNGGPFTYRAD